MAQLDTVSAASCSTRQWPAVLRWKWTPAGAIPHDPTRRTAGHRRVITLESDWRSKEEVLKGMTDTCCWRAAVAIRVNWKPTCGRRGRFLYRSGL